MARWLQSAGLQHLASSAAAAPAAAAPDDHRASPSNLILQGYGPQTVEEKQRLYFLLRSLNLNGESASESFAPTGQGFGATSSLDGFYSSDLRSEFGAGLLDLHAMDDSELLTENVNSEPFEPSPFISKGTDDVDDLIPDNQQDIVDNSGVVTGEKDAFSRGSNVAKIKVVVRKRPLNKKEIGKKEDDIVTVHENAYLTVHEPKLKVDLTAYVEKHEFCFDAVLDEDVTNDEVYCETVKPIIPSIFQQTKATCFAYGQTGSGKTYTMQPLPLRAAEEMLHLLHQPVYRNQNFKLWLSYFEIYGGKLFDLLSDRRKLLMREDGKQQVCIVGLQEFEVSDVQIVKEFIEKGNSTRSTGSTGANEESSRSHAILQLVVKKHKEVTDTRRRKDGNELKISKVVGKMSFIDLAGSERGADTTDNDRQTRIEGAEINKSLLALKECIRALDNDQIHIPFRGSKLTEVLRDSFVGNSRTVMISCISPNAGSCEHTLNTLRYADRVKSLSKSGNPKKDQIAVLSESGGRETVVGSSYSLSADADEAPNQDDYLKLVVPARGYDNSSNLVMEPESSSLGMIPNITQKAANGDGDMSFSVEKERIESKTNYRNYTTKFQSAHYSVGMVEEERARAVSPPRKKGNKDEKSRKQSSWTGKESGIDLSDNSDRQQKRQPEPLNDTSSNALLGQNGNEGFDDAVINAILEEEEALIAAHRREIENSMEIVHEEMTLLAEVDQPGSLIDNYVAQLSFLLSRKTAGLVSLQARLARFQHRLKEQEILSRKRVAR